MLSLLSMILLISPPSYLFILRLRHKLTSSSACMIIIFITNSELENSFSNLYTNFALSVLNNIVLIIEFTSTLGPAHSILCLYFKGNISTNYYTNNLSTNICCTILSKIIIESQASIRIRCSGLCLPNKCA